MICDEGPPSHIPTGEVLVQTNVGCYCKLSYKLFHYGLLRQSV